MPSLQWVDAAAAKVGLSLMGSFVDRNCSAVAGERIIVDRLVFEQAVREMVSAFQVLNIILILDKA